jgi:5,10-methylene-tetrahydrofolate dehydrogenase/methenyl tetrahydrofolate cyclohydrolase
MIKKGILFLKKKNFEFIYLCNVYGYFRRYFAGGVCKCNTDLTGKTVIVTGGATGIGKEVALALAKKGKSLIVINKSLNYIYIYIGTNLSFVF